MDRRRSLLKIAALRSEREQQVGVNIGDRQSVSLSSITAFISAPVPIGTSDFTLEYFGNAYWATSGNSPLIFNNNSRYPYGKGCLLIYGDSKVAVQWVLFEMPSSGAATDDSILLSAGDRETPFQFVVTRKGTTVKAYFEGGAIMPVFWVDPATLKLYVTYQNGYEGAKFKLENGKLYTIKTVNQ